jgi:DNA-binding transcriptional regulator YiaG
VVARKRQAEEAIPVASSQNALMSAEDVRKVRTILGMTQQEFAILLGVTALTINSWEKVGVESVRGGSFFLLHTVIALLKQAQKTPDFISPEKLKEILKQGVEGKLIPKYRTVSEMMADEFYYVISMGMLTGAMAAMLFDVYLEKKGLMDGEDSRNSSAKLFSVDDLQA